MSHQKAFISGCASTHLSDEEMRFFATERPWGFILFKRNCESKEQIRALVQSLRGAAEAPQAPVFIDQEGGRVQRLAPPIWRAYPPGKRYADLYEEDNELGENAAFKGARLIAHDLREIGIDADCLPLLDVPVRGAHDVIGDRAYGTDRETIIKLGRQIANGLLEGGVLPVVKHIPGHGRAGADSHHQLPVVHASKAELEEQDFHPFRTLNDLPMAMTAHVVYTAYDDRQPCSTSATVIHEVIRSIIGFDGLLMSDDVSMNALYGEIGDRTEACFAAGCDFVLHCNGKLHEMQAVAANTPILDGRAAERAEATLRWRKTPTLIDHDRLLNEFDALLASG